MNASARRRFGAALAASLFVLAAVRADGEEPSANDRPQAPEAAPASTGKTGQAVATPPGGPATSASDAGNDDSGKSAGNSAGKSDAGNDDAGKAREDEPRHGARKNAPDGTLLVYDKVVGAYRSTTHPATYWADGKFWRFEDGIWTSSQKAAGPWDLVAQGDVPESARGQHGAPKQSVTIKLASGREAIFEPRIRCYKVVGRKGVFLFDGTFYRFDGGVWFDAKSDDGPWAPTSSKPLPAPLKRALPVPEHGQKVTTPSGETLVYDADSKLYSVEQRPSAVFFDGSFYERKDDRWMKSVRGGAEMEPIAVTAVPVPVRSKYHTPAGKKAGAAKKAADKKATDKKAAGNKAKGANAGKQKLRKADATEAKKAGSASAAAKSTAGAKAANGTTSPANDAPGAGGAASADEAPAQGAKRDAGGE